MQSFHSLFHQFSYYYNRLAFEYLDDGESNDAAITPRFDEDDFEDDLEEDSNQEAMERYQRFRNLQGFEPTRTTTKNWMTYYSTLDEVPDFAYYTIRNITIPGVHNAGMRSINMKFPQNKVAFDDLMTDLSYSGFNGMSMSSRKLKKLLESTYCPQQYTIPKVLQLGARYLELKVQAYNDYPEFLMISNLFQSSYLLSQVLDEVQSFMERNPGEIVILDIKQDNHPLAPAYDADIDLQIANLVLDSIDRDLILDDTYLDDYIYTYGGVYITGFSTAAMAADQVFPTIDILKTEATVYDDDPDDLVSAVYTYFESGSYPISSHDFLSVDMYVTPTGADITATWTYKLSAAYKTDVAADDVDIYDILGDLKEQGDYVTY